MGSSEIVDLRHRLNLSQSQLAALLGVHWITVSRWERGELVPDPYRRALLGSFQQAAHRQPTDNVADVIVGAGVVAAIFMLLKAAIEDKPSENRRSGNRGGAKSRRRSRS